LIREGVAIGAIVLRRTEARLFSERQIALLQTFADQAAIAIENTRLLNELRESLQRQTATSEVLQVVSSSPGELEPVFQGVLENATRLCEAKFGVMFYYQDGALRPAAELNVPPPFSEFIRQRGPFQPTAWIKAKAQLETEWSAFETEVKKYVDTFGKKIEQQQATFKLQAAAQLKAWREVADKLRTAGKEFAAERQGEIEATVKRMEADAAVAEERLQKLNQAGMQSWSALMGALAETRAAFDRANQAAQEAFKRAA
jgi:hypothetical protein